MSLRTQLQAMVDGMPPGSSVSLPVDWLQSLLEQEVKRVGDMPDDLLTLEEVGKRLGRAVSTARSWCNSGKIPGAFRLHGKDWRIPTKALQELIESQSRAEQAPKGIPSHPGAELASWRRLRPAKGKGRVA